MTITVRSFSIAALLAASACAETAPSSLDGEYRVAIVQTSNTCSSATIGDDSPGLTTRLDLFRRSDGLYDLHWVDGWVPDDFAFSGVDIGDGQIQHGLGSPSEVTGLVTPDELELELVYRAVRSDTHQACERRAAVRGHRRPMFAADSVDGRYIVTVESLGGTCPDGTSVPPAKPWNMRMEVLPFRDDRTSVVIEDLRGGLLRFWIEPIGHGGAVHLTHDVFFSATMDNITQLDGTVEGSIEPTRVTLAATTYDKNDPSACATSYVISGRRWVPSASSVDAEYRTRYRITDTCAPSNNATYEQVADAVAEDDDRVDLINNVIQATVSLDGATIATSGGSPSYRGTVTPDRAAYVVEAPYTSNGMGCMFSVEVDGAARYREP